MFSFLETDVNELWGPYCSACVNTKFIGHVKAKDDLRQLMIFKHDGEKAFLKTLPDLRSENSWASPFPLNEGANGDVRCLSCQVRAVDSCSETTATEEFKTSPSNSLGMMHRPCFEPVSTPSSCEMNSAFIASRSFRGSRQPSQRKILTGHLTQADYLLSSDDEITNEPDAVISETSAAALCSSNSSDLTQYSSENKQIWGTGNKSASDQIPVIVVSTDTCNDHLAIDADQLQPVTEAKDVFEEALGIYLQFFKLRILHEEIMVSQFKMSEISNNDLASKTPQKYFQPHRHFIGLLSSTDCSKPRTDWCILQAFDCGNFATFSPQIDQSTVLNTTLFVVPDEIFKQYEQDSRALKFRFLSIIAGYRSENVDVRYPSIKSQVLGLRNLIISHSEDQLGVSWSSRKLVLGSHEKWKKMVVLASSPQCIYSKVESILHLCFSKSLTLANGEKLFDVLFDICRNNEDEKILSILDQVLPSFENSLTILAESVNTQFSPIKSKWIFDLDEDQLREFQLEPCQRAVGEISLPNRWRSSALRGKKKDEFELKVLYNEEFNINLLREEPVLCIVPDIETSCRPVAVSHLDHILKVQRARLHHEIPILNVVLIHVSFDRYMEYAEGDRLQSYPIYEDSLTTGLVYHLRYIIEKREIIWARRRNMSFSMMPCSVTLLLSLAPEECFTPMMSIIGKWKSEEYAKRQQLFNLLADVAWTNPETVFLELLKTLAPSMEKTFEILSTV